MQKRRNESKGAAGFSLLELMVALGVTLVIMVVAGRMLAMTMNVRTRENQRTEAIADAQRALQAMTRDITNAGLGLSTNGITCDNPDEDVYGELRIRSNLNAFTETTPDTTDADEDVVYSLINDATVTPPQRLVTRQDVNTGQISQLANRIDGLHFDFLNADDTAATSPATAVKVKITVWVALPAVGTAGATGYQPPTRMQLSSQATLRNSMLTQ
ncbi:MAG TPA: prepilin-type N-terminal cleavage/methylation domain-containing protein [Pyrinomonadaceae bacterium]|jgi:Tfp pilus assembly protein PilW|nr:prepilin-type N-terminal cleavage/methylation domain-containing protein [Pyrinomonadaceae bacterium]